MIDSDSLRSDSFSPSVATFAALVGCRSSRASFFSVVGVGSAGFESANMPRDRTSIFIERLSAAILTPWPARKSAVIPRARAEFHPQALKHRWDNSIVTSWWPCSKLHRHRDDLSNQLCANGPRIGIYFRDRNRLAGVGCSVPVVYRRPQPYLFPCLTPHVFRYRHLMFSRLSTCYSSCSNEDLSRTKGVESPLGPCTHSAQPITAANQRPRRLLVIFCCISSVLCSL